MPISPTPNSTPKLRRTVKAVKSGFRRYPKAIYQSLKDTCPQCDPIHLPEILHDLAHHNLAILWLGHASLVAQLDDITIAVDPVLSNRIGMKLKNKTIGIPRLTPPPISPESLIDTNLLLITHAHFDHLDKPTLEAMRSDTTTVIVPHRCAKLIPTGFNRVIELNPGSTIELAALSISAIEPKHWGARSLFDRRRGVNSYLVESKTSSNTQRVLFAGDTAETKAYDHLEAIDLAVFGIGAYDPWDHMHATPEQAWRMFQAIGARFMLPIHHSTFELSDEPIDEPMRRLYEIATEHTASILEPTIGEIIVIDSPTADSPTPTSPSTSRPDTPQPPTP